MDIRIEHLSERRVAVVQHRGPLSHIDDTRRPLYQHMIMNELVGGPSAIRFPRAGDLGDEPERVDLLVGTQLSFEGDDYARVELLPAGPHAVLDYEGPAAGLADARRRLARWVEESPHAAAGPLLQVHLMDEIDGETEQQLQVLLAAPPGGDALDPGSIAQG